MEFRRVLFRSFSGNPVMMLQPGDYDIAISATGTYTGSYDFRLLDLAAANELTLGEDQTITLNPGNVTQLFAFDAVAGQRLYFDRSEEYTSELQSLMRTSYAGLC